MLMVLLLTTAVHAQPSEPPRPLPNPSAPAQPLPSPAVPAPPTESPADPQAQAYRLIYKFAPGQTVHYEVVHKMTITSQKQQASETVSNESKSLKHYRVVSVEEDGSGTLELMIDRVEMSARHGDDDPIVFDSDSAEPPPRQFQDVKRSVGRLLARTKIAPSGRLVSATRLYNPYADGEQEGGQNGDKEPAPNILVTFPERPIRVGEQWQDDPPLSVRVRVTNTLTRNVDILRKYKLAKVEGHLATIETRSEVLTPIREPAIRGQLIQRTPEGTIVFDMERGVIVSRVLKVNRTEFGVFEGDGSMRAISERVERLVPAPAVARKPE